MVFKPAAFTAVAPIRHDNGELVPLPPTQKGLGGGVHGVWPDEGDEGVAQPPT